MHAERQTPYDRIDRSYRSGRAYAETRRPDPRIARAIRSALGDIGSLVNIGAGAGSYEPTDLAVVPVEPSERMIALRPPPLPPAIRGVAEALPLADQSVDAALAVLSSHHWDDRKAAFLRDPPRRAPARRLLHP